MIARFLMGLAYDFGLDRRGPLFVPRELRDYAGLVDDLTVIGVCAHIEIWSSQLFRQHLEANLGCPPREGLTKLLEMG